MDRRGNCPDVLAIHIANAVSLAENAGFGTRLLITSPPRGAVTGPQRVVRQRVSEDGLTLELTVAAEDWGKEV